MFVIRFHIFITTRGGGRQGCNLYIPDLLLSYKILKNYLDFVTGDELAPHHHGGNPLLPIDTVLVGLSILGGGHYYRVSAILEGVAIQTASTHLKRLCDAVNLVLAPLKGTIDQKIHLVIWTLKKLLDKGFPYSYT